MGDERYPIGQLRIDGTPTPETRKRCIDDMARTPADLRKALDGLPPRLTDIPYRDGGWTVRQMTHHLADSLVNAYARFRFALTEREPTIKPFDQDAWAVLADVASVDPAVSVSAIEALTIRLTALLSSLAETDFRRAFIHPERGRMSLDDYLQLCAWHGRHHVAHIEAFRRRRGAS